MAAPDESEFAGQAVNDGKVEPRAAEKNGVWYHPGTSGTAAHAAAIRARASQTSILNVLSREIPIGVISAVLARGRQVRDAAVLCATRLCSDVVTPNIRLTMPFIQFCARRRWPWNTCSRSDHNFMTFPLGIHCSSPNLLRFFHEQGIPMNLLGKILDL